MPGFFKEWMDERKLSPLRVSFGEPKGSWFAWMLHGDFTTGQKAPQGMIQAAADPAKASTSIRIAAIGPDDTWLLIWEDGTMVSVLKDEYKDLLRKLQEHDVNDISVSRADRASAHSSCLSADTGMMIVGCHQSIPKGRLLPLR
jgi:hypothetical protein